MDQQQLAALVRMADRVEIAQLMGKFTQYFDQFNAEKILHQLMAADHPEVSVEFMECGLYQGPEKVQAYMEGIQAYLDDPADKRGWMGLQNLSNPHIVVSSSGNRARGQWDILNANAMQAAEYPAAERKLTALWVCGRYDNEFIRVDGQWKLLKVHLVTYFKTPFDQGWLKNADCLRPCGNIRVEPTRVSPKASTTPMPPIPASGCTTTAPICRTPLTTDRHRYIPRTRPPCGGLSGQPQ